MERTRGDRRLGTHVLSGLDILLPHLTGVCDGAATSSALDDLLGRADRHTEQRGSGRFGEHRARST